MIRENINTLNKLSDYESDYSFAKFNTLVEVYQDDEEIEEYEDEDDDEEDLDEDTDNSLQCVRYLFIGLYSVLLFFLYVRKLFYLSYVYYAYHY
jgi:hypothetical protein